MRGLQPSQHPVTRLPIGTRRDVTEITLFIHTGLQGRVDIQVAPLTPIAELYQYVATIIGVTGRDIDLTHTNTGSIADHGTVFGHVPGISDWGNLEVHRHLHLQIRVYAHTATTTNETATTELATVPVEARSDTNGTHIWRWVLRQLYPQHDDFPDPHTPSLLRVVSPTRVLLDERLSLWAHEDLPPGTIYVDMEAHLGESLETRLLLESHTEQNNPLPMLFDATQPWSPPRPDHMRGGALTDRGQAQGTVNYDLDPPPGLPPQGADHAPAAPPQAFNETNFLAELMDSILIPSSQYGRALQISEGPLEDHLTPEQIKRLGANVFQSWEVLERVLTTLHYRVGHACPWRQLGVPHLEGPPPSAAMADLRLHKAIMLLAGPKPTTWTEQDTANALQAGERLRAAYRDITTDLPQVLRLRARNPAQLTPPYAELPGQILASIDTQLQEQGLNWRAAVMLSNVQEAPLDTLSRIMPVSEARVLYDNLVRDPDRGRNTLAGLGASAGLLMWAPFEHDLLHRLISMYEVVLTQMPDPPTCPTRPLPRGHHRGPAIRPLAASAATTQPCTHDSGCPPAPGPSTLHSVGIPGPKAGGQSGDHVHPGGQEPAPYASALAKSDNGNPHGTNHSAGRSYGRSLGRPSSHTPSTAPWTSSL